MLLTDARRPARTGPQGQLIPLAQQDRTLWNRDLIEEGSRLIHSAFSQGHVGPYQIQAAIAVLHDEAPSTDKTDWPQIAALYAVLLKMTNNPMVALNHVVARSMVDGAEVGLQLVEGLEKDHRMKGHFRIDAVKGHLYEKLQDYPSAATHFEAAAHKTTSIPERNYLAEKAALAKSRTIT